MTLCCLSLTLLLNSFFISLAVGNLSVSLQVVLKDSCWISSWNSDIAHGRG